MKQKPRPYPREVVFDTPPKLQLDFFENCIILTQRTKVGWSSYPIDAADVAQALSNVPSSTGLLPPNTLAYGIAQGSPYYCIYVPPRVIKLSFDDWASGGTFHIPTPPLIWSGWKRDYTIWALNTLEYPSEETLLAYAPFPNVYTTDGGICWGDSDERAIASPSTIMPMLDLFLTGSRFNTHLAGSKSNRAAGNITNLYYQINGLGSYPLDDLRLASRTVGDVIKGAWNAS